MYLHTGKNSPEERRQTEVQEGGEKLAFSSLSIYG